MINKDKVFVISSNVDDSIKSASIYSEVMVFKTFKNFEDYVDITPIDASIIIVNSKDLQFTNNSMNRLVNIINSTFVTIDKYIYYMVDDEDIKNKVDELCDKNGYDKIKCLLSESLHAKDVADVLSGESLSSRETVTEIRTYRIRASDYVRSQKDKELIDYGEPYETDEDQLSGIPDEPIPEDLRATEIPKAIKHIVCGHSLRERSSWVLLKAQYLSMTGKTIILERDMEYHTLLDMISKLDIDYEFYDIVDLFRDCYDLINQIKASKHKLIFIGSKSRIQYNYDILMNVLISNLDEDVEHYIYETDVSNVPYGSNVDIVMPTTVPEILKGINKMSSIASFKDILFIGLNTTSLGSVNITELEFKRLLEELFQDNEVRSVVVKTKGLLLRKEIGLGGIFMYN